MLEVPSLIATLTTLYLIIIEDIEKYLPEIKEFCDKDKSFYPTLKSKSVIIEPSSHEILHCFDILYYTIENFLFQIKESLESFRKLEIGLHSLYI
jgi:hypothetical protein